MIEIEEILLNVEKRLRREEPGAIATGVGVFVQIWDGEKLLLKKRLPKEGGIGVGRVELPGGAIDIADFGNEYDSAPINGSVREVLEETGLIIPKRSVLLRPAWAIYQAGDQIDLAFVYLVDFKKAKATQEYKSLLEKGDLIWVSKEKIAGMEFVSKRMKFLATRD